MTDLCEFIDCPVCECNSECSNEVCTKEYSLTCQWANEKRKENSMEKEVKVLHEFFVAGVKFHQLHKCIKDIKVGDHLLLVAEPTNKYDPNAVRIEYTFSYMLEGEEVPPQQIMLGYVPKKISAQISAAMVIKSLGCIVKEVNPSNDTWTQLLVAITEEGEVENEDNPEYN